MKKDIKASVSGEASNGLLRYLKEYLCAAAWFSAGIYNGIEPIEIG